MKIFTCIKAGMSRSVRAWIGIVIVWFCSLLIVSLVAIPMNSALKAGLGNSMITEKLKDGINLEVFADMGENFGSLNSYFSSGLFVALVVAFFINSFLAAGLFNSQKGLAGFFSSSEFFRASAKYFWSFILISLIIGLIVLLAAILIVVIPVAIATHAEVPSEGAVIKTGIIATSFFLLVLTFFFLVADYARAWQVTQEKNACFNAIGFGFSQTLKTFYNSYTLMIVLLLVQLLYGWLVLLVLAGIKPHMESGIVLLFILSQLLFFIKILLKVWRYGSVTRMMEGSGNIEE